jgi:hypothetical protein
MSLQPIEPEVRALEPADVVIMARKQADALMGIVEDRKLYQLIGDKKYLMVEAWATIGAFNQVSANTEWVRSVKNENGEVIAYDALVNLKSIVDGSVRGSGLMRCGLDDFPCRGKTGTSKHKAAMSAAQTWAVSKAYRMNYSFVVVLAGFQPTPAEEMAEPAKAPAPQGPPCPFHPDRKLVWNTNDKGSWWSHKESTTKSGWCNPRGVPLPTPAASAQPASEAPQSEEDAEAEYLREQSRPIDAAPHPADEAKHELPTD